jgi:S-adenosylmethionine synthetase
MMFGFACDETDDLLPLPIWLAHRLSMRLAQVRRTGQLGYLRPDGKTQVSIAYEGGRAVAIDTIVVSAQHQEGVHQDQIRADVLDHVITPVLPKDLDRDGLLVYTNPSGAFVFGGPSTDTGLTGRKIIVDTYGGMARHGGGAFSGKDPSKVDRSGAYAARWVAKHVVASGAARRCEVRVAYAIGVARPISVELETFDTAAADPAKIADAVGALFDLRPAAIIEDLELRRPLYRKTAAYGHFGRPEREFTWEQTPRADELRRALGL